MKSTGPWEEEGRNNWICSPDPTYSQLYDGIVAALNGFNLLRSQPDVDKARIGITGGSWGGYLTTMISSLKQDRIKTAFAVYGAGYYDLGTSFDASLVVRGMSNRDIWLENFDAGRVAENMTAPYFLAAAADDWFFWPSSVQATWDEITAPKNIVYSANTHHSLSFPGGNVGPTPVDASVHRAMEEIPWMDYHLQDKGKPFPRCSAVADATRDGQDIRVSFTVDAPEPLTSTSVWYSYGETPWRTRFWQEVQAQADGDGRYTASLTVEEPDQPLSWYGLVTDKRDISVSTPMQAVNPANAGFTMDDRQASTWAPSMESGEKWETPWQSPHDVSTSGKFQFVSDGYDGEPAIEITGQYALDCFGLRGLTQLRNGSTGLTLWARSDADTGFTVQVISEYDHGFYDVWQSEQPNPGSEWTQILIPWADFQSLKSPPRGPVLSERTAKLRIVTPENADIFISGVTPYGPDSSTDEDSENPNTGNGDGGTTPGDSSSLLRPVLKQTGTLSTLNLKTENSHGYQLYISTDLTNWKPGETMTGNGNVHTFEWDRASSEAQALFPDEKLTRVFFRIEISPAL
jgi:dienelactone hydrolase